MRKMFTLVSALVIAIGCNVCAASQISFDNNEQHRTVRLAEETINDQAQAMIYMEKFIKNSPRFRHLLEGSNVKLSYSRHNPDASDGLENHEIKVIEDHPTHISTRATFRINEMAHIWYYDVVMDKLERVQ